MTSSSTQNSLSPVTPEALARHEKLRGTARKWVATTFFGALLKQMRESPFRSEIFDGGRGGQAFGSLFDQHLADRMSCGSGKQLADSIVRKIEGHRIYKQNEEAIKAQRESNTAAQSNTAHHGSGYVPTVVRT